MTLRQNDSTGTATLAQRAVAEHLRLLTAGDLQAWVGLYEANAMFTFPFAPDGMPTELQGHEALLGHMQNFISTFDVQAVDLRFVETADPQSAVATWTLDGTARPTGKSFNQPCIGVVRTDGDGRITRYDDYWNPLAAIAALQPSDTEASGGIAGSFGA